MTVMEIIPNSLKLVNILEKVIEFKMMAPGNKVIEIIAFWNLLPF